MMSSLWLWAAVLCVAAVNAFPKREVKQSLMAERKVERKEQNPKSEVSRFSRSHPNADLVLHKTEVGLRCDCACKMEREKKNPSLRMHQMLNSIVDKLSSFTRSSRNRRDASQVGSLTEMVVRELRHLASNEKITSEEYRSVMEILRNKKSEETKENKRRKKEIGKTEMKQILRKKENVRSEPEKELRNEETRKSETKRQYMKRAIKKSKEAEMEMKREISPEMIKRVAKRMTADVHAEAVRRRGAKRELKPVVRSDPEIGLTCDCRCEQEKGANRTCSHDEFRCLSGQKPGNADIEDDGPCISFGYRCDNVIDCMNAEDELDCPYTTESPTELPKEPSTEGPTTKANETCSSNQFHCVSGALQQSSPCITIGWKCDYYQDCKGNEDELDCPYTTESPTLAPKEPSTEGPTTKANEPCSNNQFYCVSGRNGRNNPCISLHWVCDNDRDCINGEDELYCQYSTESPTAPPKEPSTEGPTTKANKICSSNQFQCVSGRNGTKDPCICLKLRCDDHNDCVGGEDEQNCPHTTENPTVEKTTVPNVTTTSTESPCGEGEFYCSSGARFGKSECRPNRQVCNGLRDCKDGEDEMNCPQTCSSYEFKCPSGRPGSSSPCIYNRKKCDGYVNCNNGEDEQQNCTTMCSPSEFHCPSGWGGSLRKSCMDRGLVCDGYEHCNSGEDEQNCTQTCNPYQFKCPSGSWLGSSCINVKNVCDGWSLCKNGEDEQNCHNPTTQPPEPSTDRTKAPSESTASPERYFTEYRK